jgi:hypothetical protein
VPAELTERVVCRQRALGQPFERREVVGELAGDALRAALDDVEEDEVGRRAQRPGDRLIERPP